MQPIKLRHCQSLWTIFEWHYSKWNWKPCVLYSLQYCPSRAVMDNIVKNTKHIYIVYIHMICRITPIPLTDTQTQLISIHFSTEDKQGGGSTDRDSFSGLDRRDHHRHHRLQNFRHLFSQQGRYRRKQTVATSEHTHKLYPMTTTSELPLPYRIVSYQHLLMSAIAWLMPNYSFIHHQSTCSRWARISQFLLNILPSHPNRTSTVSMQWKKLEAWTPTWKNHLNTCFIHHQNPTSIALWW